MIWISYILFFIAAMAEGLQDRLLFHWGDLLRHYWHNREDYWNPKESWRNSVIPGDNGWEEKHFLSNSWLKPLYSGYHLLKLIMISCFTLAIISACMTCHVGDPGIIYIIYQSVIFIAIWAVGFYLTYKILKL